MLTVEAVDRDRFQASVARFSLRWLVSFLACMLALAGMYRFYPSTVPADILTLAPFTVSVLLALLALTLWFRFSLRPDSRFLHVADTAFVLLASLDFGLSIFLSSDQTNNIYACFIWNSLLHGCHTVMVPASRRRRIALTLGGVLPLILGAIAIVAFSSQDVTAPLPVFVVGALGLSAMVVYSTLLLHATVGPGGASREQRSTAESNWLETQFSLATRFVLRMTQTIAVRIANLGGRVSVVSPLSFHPWDVESARQIAEEVEAGDCLLDVGCGTGHRLHEIGVFRRLTRACGVDVIAAGKEHATSQVELSTYDGNTLPFPDKSFDVVMICYVLHHLSPDHAQKILREAIRVSKKRLIVMEDSMPKWSRLYQLRNWCHRLEADLEYSSGSKTFASPGTQEMFLTRERWMETLGALPGVKALRMQRMHPPMKYEHHTMFCADLDS